jgi:putative nucleotidyltransferase with HDIG domain
MAETKIFSSKISKRIFIRYVAYALLPIVCLAVIAYFQVTGHLQDQTLKTLRHAVKFQAKNFIDRLNDLENELKSISSKIGKNLNSNVPNLDERLRSRLSRQFNSISFFVHPKHFHPIYNQLEIESLPLEPDDIKHLSAGYTLMTELNFSRRKPSIIMLRQIDIENLDKGFVVGEINLNYLWRKNEIDNLPIDTAYCVLDSSDNILYISPSNMEKIESSLKTYSRPSTIGHFELKVDRKQYFASYSEMFLKPTYKLPRWTVILLKAKSDVFAPVARFRLIFPLFIILTLLVVLWLSNKSIRKNLLPIKALKQGAKRITERDFSQKVIVSSNDEFEELAVTFNQMSDALENKFKTLSAKADIDRAILSTLNRDEIIKASITHIADCIACEACGISLIDSLSSHEGRAFYSFGNNKTMSTKTLRVLPQDLGMLQRNPNYFTIQPNEPAPYYLPAKASMRKGILLVLPIWVNERLSAILWIGGIKSRQFLNEDITLSRQLADQIAVALSNSNLIEELKDMNWGTLQALARVVDAKSPWTGGHSQRVSEWALKIGSELNLQSHELENLHRAALLHDIGKVAVSSNIINKPDRLNDEEYRLIKRHPGLGAKILEPINAYKEIIPIIAQHHERFDGLGYPARIAGEEINKSARILVVADVYDALSSDRPYRKAWTLEKVIELMEKEAGHKFDPVVVGALLRIIKGKRKLAA